MSLVRTRKILHFYIEFEVFVSKTPDDGRLDRNM
jgi:hypothetical protein